MQTASRERLSRSTWLVLLAQLLLVVALETLCAVAASYSGFRSPINSIWMFGIPITVAFVANNDRYFRLSMAMIGLPVGLFAP